ncbi:MAG: hypothetical protein N2235_05375 [Fischerella sp.]|nr:hypothetical protein [Fischerella sp.]
MTVLGLHSKKFSDLVKNMNQTHGKNLVLTAEQANNLHAEIFSLLARIVELENANKEENSIQVIMQGRGFVD